MYEPIPTMNSLFEQLGLQGDDHAIEQFVGEHRPLPRHLKLHEATFWNNSQATVLQQLIEEDADWAPVVDDLDARLRHA